MKNKILKVLKIEIVNPNFKNNNIYTFQLTAIIIELI